VSRLDAFVQTEDSRLCCIVGLCWSPWKPWCRDGSSNTNAIS